MKIAAGTTMESRDMLKALTTKRSFKDLVKKGEFIVQDIMILVPDETDPEDARMSTAIKVDGEFYKGISSTVMETATQVLGYLNGEQDGILSLGALRFTMEKSAGKYGSYIFSIA